MAAWGGRRAQRLLQLTLETYGSICHLCGLPGADSSDHLVPRSLGGSDSLDNLRPAHRRCNSSRGNKLLSTSPAPKPSLSGLEFFKNDDRTPQRSFSFHFPQV